MWVKFFRLLSTNTVIHYHGFTKKRSTTLILWIISSIINSYLSHRPLYVPYNSLESSAFLTTPGYPKGQFWTFYCLFYLLVTVQLSCFQTFCYKREVYRIYQWYIVINKLQFNINNSNIMIYRFKKNIVILSFMNTIQSVVIWQSIKTEELGLPYY